MNKRTQNKKAKQEFIRLFSKDDWKFYNKYPRLFAIYSSNKKFTLNDLNRWYSKFICNIDIFQNLVRTLYVIIYNTENIDSDYRHLEKYDFKYLMNNIDDIAKYERFPRRIEEQLMHYLKSCRMSSKDTSNAIRVILEKSQHNELTIKPDCLNLKDMLNHLADE